MGTIRLKRSQLRGLIREAIDERYEIGRVAIGPAYHDEEDIDFEFEDPDYYIMLAANWETYMGDGQMAAAKQQYRKLIRVLRDRWQATEALWDNSLFGQSSYGVKALRSAGLDPDFWNAVRINLYARDDADALFKRKMLVADIEGSGFNVIDAQGLYLGEPVKARKAGKGPYR